MAMTEISRRNSANRTIARKAFIATSAILTLLIILYVGTYFFAQYSDRKVGERIHWQKYSRFEGGGTVLLDTGNINRISANQIQFRVRFDYDQMRPFRDSGLGNVVHISSRFNCAKPGVEEAVVVVVRRDESGIKLVTSGEFTSESDLIKMNVTDGTMMEIGRNICAQPTR